MKKWYLSKTIWFNALAFVVAVAAAFGYTGELAPEIAVFIPVAVALINIVLRFVSKQAVEL